MTKIVILFLGLFFFLFSCQREQENVTKTIEIDLSHIDTVRISSSKIVNLETVDSSLLYDICALFKQEDRYFIWSRDNAYVFNDKGDFLFNISRRGQGPGEYQSFACMYMEDGEVCIFDKDKQQILYFDINAKFMGVKKVCFDEDDPSPSMIIPVGTERYLSTNRFGGDDRKMPVLSFWDKNFSTQKIVKGRFLNNGIHFPDAFFIGKEGRRVLYWEPLKDTLFTVENDHLVPEYKIDFGTYAMPEEEAAKDVYARMAYLNKSENQSCASAIRFYQIDGEYLYFTFMWYDRICLCRYNEKVGKSEVFTILTEEEQLKECSFFKILGEDIVLAFEDKSNLEKNPSLCVFNKKILDI